MKISREGLVCRIADIPRYRNSVNLCALFWRFVENLWVYTLLCILLCILLQLFWTTANVLGRLLVGEGDVTFPALVLLILLIGTILRRFLKSEAWTLCKAYLRTKKLTGKERFCPTVEIE